MATSDFKVIAIGGSAGGLEAALEIVANLDARLPAAVLVVLHLGPGPAQSLEGRFERSGALPARFAADGESLQASRIYLAPPDYHFFIKGNIVQLTQGPMVNRARPAIDLTFRSVATSYNSRAIGVILSGMLDDGTTGLSAIKRCGGITIVQDPDDAAFADMPASALASVDPDYSIAAAAIGSLLNKLVAEPLPESTTVPADVILEEQLDVFHTSELPEMQSWGEQADIACPECGGAMRQSTGSGDLRYRCHVGHALTARHMLQSQSEEIERALWLALRTLEEQARLQERMIQAELRAGRSFVAKSLKRRSADARQAVTQIRALLLSLPKSSGLASNDPASA